MRSAIDGPQLPGRPVALGQVLDLAEEAMAAARPRSARTGLGQVGDGAVEQLGLGAAQQLAQGPVDAQEPAVQADQCRPDGGLVETGAEVHPPSRPRPHWERRMSGA
jgi:hypothetical protein